MPPKGSSEHGRVGRRSSVTFDKETSQDHVNLTNWKTTTKVAGVMRSVGIVQV